MCGEHLYLGRFVSYVKLLALNTNAASMPSIFPPTSGVHDSVMALEMRSDRADHVEARDIPLHALCTSPRSG